MAGGMATLFVEFYFGIFTKFSLFAAFVGALLVSTLLATVAISQLPDKVWGWFKNIPTLPARAVPYLFLVATIAGFLFGWLRW
jgi:hypothetical protein